MRYRDECMPLVSYVDTVYTTTTNFAWRSLVTGTILPLVFQVEKLFSVLWYTLPIHATSQTNSVCEVERQSACVLFLVPILLARVQCRFARTTTLEAGDAAALNSTLWLFLAQ